MNPERIVWLNHQAALWADVICRACWQSALFCIGVWLIVRLMPRLPAAPRGWLWWLACLKPLLALACVFALPIALLPPPRPDIAVPLPFAPTIAAPVPTAPQRPAPVSTSAPHSPAKAAFPLPFAPAVQITAMPPPIAPPRLSPAAMLMAAWLIGSALCLLTLLYQYHAAYRLRRRARPIMDDALAARAANIAHTLGMRQSPPLGVAPRLHGPVVTGLLHPAILLPEAGFDSLSQSEQNMVLAHELAHLRRGDLWLGLLSALARALFWFHPLVWLAAREYAVCCEMACDADALRVTGQPTADYGQMLLRFVSIKQTSCGSIELGAGAGIRQIQRRLQMLQHTVGISPRVRWRLALVLIAGVAGLLPWRVVAAPPSDADPLANNPRLEQNVALTAEGVPVGELLALIAQKSGVSLRAVAPTSDDKIVCFSPSRPLRESLRDIAALLNDKWLHSTEDGKDYYTLVRTARAKEAEDVLANTLMNRIRAQMDAQAQALHESAEELAKRPWDDPIRQRIGDPQTRAATELYASLNPGQRDTLFQQTTLHLPLSAFSMPQQEGIRKQFEQHRASMLKSKAEHPDLLLYIEEPDKLTRGGVTFHIADYFGTVQVTVGPGGGMIASCTVASQWLLPAHGAPYTHKPVPANVALPDMKVVQESGQEKDWIARLRKLAETSKHPVFADYYRSKPVTRPYDPPTPEKDAPPAPLALDTLCHPEGYLWWTQGKSLLFRKRDWYLQQQYEVPDTWLLALTRHLQAQKGVPTYGDVFNLLSLTIRQVVGLGSLKYRNERADTITGGEVNEHDLAGFYDLLTMAKSLWPAHSRLLETVSLVNKDGPEVAVVEAARIDASQRLLLTSFLEKSSQSINLETTDKIYLRLLCTGLPVPDKPGFHDGFSDVDFTLNTKDEYVGGQFFVRLCLPTVLPDDRRSQTKVEITP